eukprot:CAMPEP_0118935196 /NCGR_PEP_ID=MMETSP1169-20130426/15133_1 /TAXON_ID=36882 /ORGANISM="Pyramimonas obovata, Strain CCMP722" /LENGTH=273 /DNA_ID=CAMNT_0006878193 /DNA_START=145 /DNA_END=966 /DNA_ORIENTATION=-
MSTRVTKAQPNRVSRATFRTASHQFQNKTRAFRGASLSTAARRSLVTYAATAQDPLQSSQMLVIVPPHPLVKHHLTIARNKHTPSGAFRQAISELGKILLYEMIRDWVPTVDLQVETPCGIADATLIDPSKPIILVPILRAGLIPIEQANIVLPVTKTYHVGYVRDEESLEASLYLNKLPEKFEDDAMIVVSDPMLATGGTMVACLEELLKRGAKATNIRVLCIVACPVALSKLSTGFPGIRVYSAMIDAELNDKGYIVPGLGDAGDRAYDSE